MESAQEVVRDVPDEKPVFLVPVAFPLEETRKPAFLREQQHVRKELVPLTAFSREAVTVDNEHVEAIKKTLKPYHRPLEVQIQPCIIAEVRDGSEKRYYLCDGFHRAEAIARGGGGRIPALVIEDASLDDVYTMRLQADAHTVGTVAVGRIISTLQLAWKTTAWSNYLELAPAVSLAVEKNPSGKDLGLNHEDAQLIREWILKKCSAAERPATAIYEYLSVLGRVHPDLTRLIEMKKKGRALNMNHLRMLAKLIPHDYKYQLLLAEQAMRERWSVDVLVSHIQRLINDPRYINEQWEMHIEEVTALITDGVEKNQVSLNYMENAQLFALALRRGWVDPQTIGRKKTNYMAGKTRMNNSHQPVKEEKVDLETSIELAKAGNKEALARFLIDTYTGKLTQYVCRRLHIDEEEAEDFTQAVWLRFLSSIENYDFDPENPQLFDHYIAKIAKNMLVSHTRMGNNRMKTKSLDTSSDDKNLRDYNMTYGDESDDPSRNAMDENVVERLKEMTRGLVPAQRRIILLHHYFGLKNKEMSSLLGMTPNAATVLLFRATENIRQANRK